MAVAKDSLFWGDDDDVTEETLSLALRAVQRGYGFTKWRDPAKWDYTYGLYRDELGQGAKRVKVPLGTFETKEELIGMLKLILASEE